MPNIKKLVVLGTTLTGLAVVRSAHAAGVVCSLVDIRLGIASRSRLARTHFVDRADHSATLATLRQLAGDAPCALIADSDSWLRFILAHRETLESIFSVVLHPDQRALQICLDKNTFLDWCAEAGFSAPRRYSIQADGSLTPAAEFPLLIRPQTTRHESGIDVPKAVEARDQAALEYWLERFASVGVEPAVGQSLLRPGIRQYSIGVARNREGVVRTIVLEKLRSYPEQCAGGTFVVSSEQPAVEAWVRRVVATLGYFGIAEVEVMYDGASGESFLIEINARPWTQFALAERAGCNFLGFLLWGQEKRTASSVLRWLNFEADAYGCLSRSTGVVRQGRLGMREYLASVLSANVFAVWDRSDPGPFLHALARLAGQQFRRLVGSRSRPSGDTARAA